MSDLIHKGDEVDLLRFVAEVRQWAKVYPDAVYNQAAGVEDFEETSCSYFKGSVTNGPDTQGCIMGQAVIKNLFDDSFIDWVWEMEDSHKGIGIDCVIDGNVEWNWGDEEQEMAFDWLNRVQNLQDTGSTWRDAVNGADEYIWETHYKKFVGMP